MTRYACLHTEEKFSYGDTQDFLNHVVWEVVEERDYLLNQRVRYSREAESHQTEVIRIRAEANEAQTKVQRLRAEVAGYQFRFKRLR